MLSALVVIVLAVLLSCAQDTKGDEVQVKPDATYNEGVYGGYIDQIVRAVTDEEYFKGKGVRGAEGSKREGRLEHKPLLTSGFYPVPFSKCLRIQTRRMKYGPSCSITTILSLAIRVSRTT